MTFTAAVQRTFNATEPWPSTPADQAVYVLVQDRRPDCGRSQGRIGNNLPLWADLMRSRTFASVSSPLPLGHHDHADDHDQEQADKPSHRSPRRTVPSGES